MNSIDVNQLDDFPAGYVTVQMTKLMKQADSILITNGTRLKWDEYGLVMAQAAGLRADCTRRRIGAVILDSFHRVAGVGYNGAPSGRPGCLSAGACPRGQKSVADVIPGSSYDTGAGSCIAIHAEQNAIADATVERRRGATIYVSDMPCDGCKRFIESVGIIRAVWPGGEFLFAEAA